MAWFKRKGKFGAVRTNGFASKLEASVRQLLSLREKAKEISDIREQHRIEFPCGIGWKVDFSFTDMATGATTLCEAKGVECADYLLKKRMYAGCPIHEAPGRLEIWKGSHMKPKLSETIVPHLANEGVKT